MLISWAGATSTLWSKYNTYISEERIEKFLRKSKKIKNIKKYKIHM